MITLNTKHLHTIANEHGLTEGEIEKESALIKAHLKNIAARDQGFYSVIDEHESIEKINSFAINAEGKYDDVIVLGIGGSALGGICLQQSLTHLFTNKKPGHPTVHFLDNIDPALLSQVQDVTSLDRTLIIVITKSGGTPETISQYLYFRSLYENHNLPIKDHFIFITDPHKGLLRQIALQEGIVAFDVPENVGGRFSVLTNVGLLPAKLMGIDIERLVNGAKTMRDIFQSKNFTDNIPFQLATIQYLLAKKGKNINVLMPYAQRLIRFADWYRQLLAESIGKRLDNDGNEVFTGITPVSALGATDQHSQSQLYNEGPNDKLVIFIKIENMGPALEIPNLYPELTELNYLQGVDFTKLLHTEMKGTIQALTQNNRPTITLALDELNEETLGELFMLFESATAFLGEFFNINAFDQPGVELSKVLTKEMLQKE